MINKKLRASAKDQDCTLQIAGVCKGDSATVILAHLPDETNGMAKKSDDISSALCCGDCHMYIDGGYTQPKLRHLRKEWGESKEFYFRRAMIRTWRIWINDGLVKLP